jgi:transcriptional regulator with XRE-family HTH domain
MTLSLKARTDLGRKIRIARMRINMSQKDLARYLKVTDKSISAYETGKIAPPTGVLRKISIIVQQPLTFFDTKARPKREDLLARIKVIEAEVKEMKRLIQVAD